jgi:hypothetical protein
MIGVLGGLMIGEEAFRIAVQSATRRVVANAGKKTRHYFVLSEGRQPTASSVNGNLNRGALIPNG